MSSWSVQHYYDLGMLSSSLPNSYDTLCMLNCQRERHCHAPLWLPLPPAPRRFNTPVSAARRLPPLGWNTWCTSASCYQPSIKGKSKLHDNCSEVSRAPRASRAPAVSPRLWGTVSAAVDDSQAPLSAGHCLRLGHAARKASLATVVYGASTESRRCVPRAVETVAEIGARAAPELCAAWRLERRMRWP